MTEPSVEEDILSELIEVRKDLRATKTVMRVMWVVIALLIITIGVGGKVVQDQGETADKAQHAAEEAAQAAEVARQAAAAAEAVTAAIQMAQKTNCENSNESREVTRNLWVGIFTAPRDPDDPPRSEQDVINLQKVLDYINKAYAERDCNDLGRKYPAPEFPDLSR